MLHTRVKSGIRLDPRGRFWHDDEPVEHPAIARAWHQGLERTADGRYIVRFGRDWAYVLVEDAPFLVVRARVDGSVVHLALSDDSSELLRPETLAASAEGILYCQVKGDHRARFSRQAQADLMAELAEQNGRFALLLGGQAYPVGDRPGDPPPRPEDGPAPPDDARP